MDKSFPAVRAIALAVSIGILGACGGTGDNSDLKTIGDQVTPGQKDAYYIPNDFYQVVQYVSETLQYQSSDSYLLYSYSEDFQGKMDQTTILADGLPGDTLYARVLITGLSADALADVSIVSEGDFAEFALDVATGNYGETTYEDDVSKLEFQTGPAQVANGTWVWVKIPLTEYEQTRSVQLFVGNETNPETGLELESGIKTASIVASTPAANSQPLTFEFSDLQGRSALLSGETRTVSIELTELQSIETPISDLVTENGHQIVGLTAESAPIILETEEGVAAYRIQRRGAEQFGPWTTETGSVEPYDRVEVRITASETKLASVTASLTIGEGDNAISDDWVVDTLGDIDMSRGVLYPPQNGFTNAKKVDARGRVLLRDTAAQDTELSSLVLRKLVTSDPEAVEEVIDLMPEYNATNGLWAAALVLPEEASTQYTLEAVTSLGEVVVSPFIVSQADSVPESFPSEANKLTHGHDVSVDLANNRYIVNNTPWNAAHLIAVDMTTSERTEIMDTNALWGGKSNSFSVQVDPVHNRVLTGDNPSDDIYQFDLTDLKVNSIFSSHKAPVVGTGPYMAEPSEMDLDYDNHRVVGGHDNGGAAGLYVYDMTTGDRWKYASGRVKSTAVDHDFNRYLFITGNNGDALMSAPIVPMDEGGNLAPQEATLMGIDSYSNGRSVAVASYKELETPLALQHWSADGFVVDGQPVAEELQVGFALIADKSDKAVYKVNLLDGSRELFSANGVPDYNVPFDTPEAVVVESGLGYALVSDVVTQALFAIDLETGQRIIISK